MQRLVRALAFLCLTLSLFASSGLAQQNPRDNDSTAGLPAAHPPKARGKSGQEAEGDDAKARMLYMRQQYGIASPEFKRRAMQARAKRKAQEGGRGKQTATSSAVSNSQAATGPTWIPIGPTGASYQSNGGFSGDIRDSGRARRFLPHPTDADTLYFLTSGGGLWVTHNFTAAHTTWVPLTDDLPTTSGGSMAFGRTPSIIYLGTGDPFDEINIGGSMTKSTDGGQTWSTPFDLGAALSIRDVLVDTSGAEDVILAATTDGLYRSIDSGTTYAQVLGGPGELFAGQVFWTIVRTSAGIIANGQTCAVAATGSRPGASCGTQSTMFVSTDLGATWAPVPNTGNLFSGAGRATLAVGAPGDATVYAFAENTASNDQKDLFRSTDGGLNWVALGINPKVATNAAGNTDNSNMDLMHGQAFYNQMILVDPRDSARNTVYLGGNLSSAKTSDGGNTWTLLSNWLPDVGGGKRFGLPYVHADFQTAAFTNAGGTPTLIFGSDGGIFVSTDEGANFTTDKNNGLQTALLYSVSSTPAYPNNVIGGLQDAGTRVREGDSEIYNQSVGGDGISATWSQVGAGLALTTLPGSLFRYQNNNQIPEVFESWLSLSVPAVLATTFFTPITIPDPSSSPTGKIFYTASAGRINKVDFSAGLPVVSTVGTAGFPGLPVQFRPGPRGIGVSPVDLNHIGIPGTGGNVMLTANGGANWTAVSLNTAVPGFQSFMQSLTYVDNSTLFATSVAPLAGAVRVAKSSDGGASWTRADSGLPDVQIEKIYVDPSDATKQTLLAATYDGVYRSTDQGANWAPFGTGLPNVFVRDIYMPPDGGFIRIATYGRGFWELPMLTYINAALVDDINSCDHNGSLDNGETGTLTVTLRNGGASTLSSITGTVSSTNPAVSFPDGNSISFAPADAHANTTGSVHVSLSGAAGIQQLDLKISYTDPSLGLPSPAATTASFRGNVDITPNGSANDTFEANDTWTVGGTAEALPDTLNWRYIQASPIEHRWEEVDSNATTDQTLTSPVMHVGSGPFGFSFEHRFRFENGGGLFFDGMVLEISTDGGSSWADAGATATPAYPHTIAAGSNALAGRPAYSGVSVGWPAWVPVSVDLGTAYANQDVRIRFRVGTDENGFGTGGEIRNFATTGLTNTPFTAVVAHSGVCGTGMSVNTSASPASFGDSVTFTATVTGGVSTATGNVAFSDGVNSLGTTALDASGNASVSSSGLSVGSHTITASYAGDSGHAANSATVDETINQASSSAKVTSSLNPSDDGQSVTFTATITVSGAVNPTGTVSFTDSANSLGSVALASGKATVTTSALTDGSHTIGISYGGDTNYVGSSDSMTQVVRAPSSTSLGSSLNPSVYGQSVTFTATVTSGAGTPTGSVSFTDGVNVLGTGSLNGSGVATFTTSALSVAAHSIKATYAGDGNFIGSASSTLTQSVTKGTTTTAVSSAPNPSFAGQSVTFTATVVSPTGGIATGTVTFKRGPATLGTGTLDGTGHATLTISTLAAGNNSISAIYGGSSNLAGSTSGTINQVVKPNPSSTALQSSVNPSVRGQSVTFTATVTSGTGTPSGNVTFKDGNKKLATINLNGSGQAAFSTSSLGKGSHNVTAVYNGDSSRSGSTSDVVVQNVN